MWGPMGGSWIVFPLVGLVMMAVMVVVMTTVLRNGNRGGGPACGPWASGDAAGQDSALDVLSRRYAAGELDDDEYERRRATLLRRR